MYFKYYIRFYAYVLKCKNYTALQRITENCKKNKNKILVRYILNMAKQKKLSGYRENAGKL